MRFGRTRETPQAIPLKEKTAMPNYVNERTGHLLNKVGHHFHGMLRSRPTAEASVSGQSSYKRLGMHPLQPRSNAQQQSNLFTGAAYETAIRTRSKSPTALLVSQTPPLATFAPRSPKNMQTTYTNMHRAYHSVDRLPQDQQTHSECKSIHVSSAVSTDTHTRSTDIQRRIVNAAPSVYFKPDQVVSGIAKNRNSKDEVVGLMVNISPKPLLTTNNLAYILPGRSTTPTKIRANEHKPSGKICSAHWNVHNYE